MQKMDSVKRINGTNLSDQVNSEELDKRFKEELEFHLNGWKEKAQQDFSEVSFNKELMSLKSDNLYKMYGLATPEYALIRLMGRMSISIGRRLGEIYDKIPRVAAQDRYNLKKEQVVLKLSGLELDIALKYEELPEKEKENIEALLLSLFPKIYKQGKFSGIGIEIRYNFNPNDSSRLRKDEEMADLVKKEAFFPIYLIFSTISPREEAISRLRNSGWNFLIGEDASEFSEQVFGLDFEKIMENPNIKETVEKEIDSMMCLIYKSYAFNKATEN